eukprot:2861375-Rhodomonas_salina.1
MAIRKAAEDEAAEKAAEAAERAKRQKLAPEPKSKRLAKKQEAVAAGKEAEQQQAAAEEASARLAAAAIDNAAKAEGKEGKERARKPADRAAAASKIVIPDQQLLKLVKLAHGSGRPKVDLAREFMGLFPDVVKSRADKYISTLFYKKEGRLTIVEERLANPFVAEVAADAWKANTAAGGAAPSTGGRVRWRAEVCGAAVCGAAAPLSCVVSPHPRPSGVCTSSNKSNALEPPARVLRLLIHFSSAGAPSLLQDLLLPAPSLSPALALFKRLFMPASLPSLLALFFTSPSVSASTLTPLPRSLLIPPRPPRASPSWPLPLPPLPAPPPCRALASTPEPCASAPPPP